MSRPLVIQSWSSMSDPSCLLLNLVDGTLTFYTGRPQSEAKIFQEVRHTISDPRGNQQFEATQARTHRQRCTKASTHTHTHLSTHAGRQIGRQADQQTDTHTQADTHTQYTQRSSAKQGVQSSIKLYCTSNYLIYDSFSESKTVVFYCKQIKAFNYHNQFFYSK